MAAHDTGILAHLRRNYRTPNPITLYLDDKITAIMIVPRRAHLALPEQFRGLDLYNRAATMNLSSNPNSIEIIIVYLL